MYTIIKIKTIDVKGLESIVINSQYMVLQMSVKPSLSFFVYLQKF